MSKPITIETPDDGVLTLPFTVDERLHGATIVRPWLIDATGKAVRLTTGNLRAICRVLNQAQQAGPGEKTERECLRDLLAAVLNHDGSYKLGSDLLDRIRQALLPAGIVDAFLQSKPTPAPASKA